VEWRLTFRFLPPGGFQEPVLQPVQARPCLAGLFTRSAAVGYMLSRPAPGRTNDAYLFFTLPDVTLPALKVKASHGWVTPRSRTKLLPEPRWRYLLQNGRGNINLNSVSPICCFSADVSPYPGRSARAGPCSGNLPPRWDSQGLSFLLKPRFCRSLGPAGGLPPIRKMTVGGGR